MKIKFYESPMCCPSDPASNLADVLKKSMGYHVTPSTVIANLGLTGDDLVAGLRGHMAPAKAEEAILFVALAGFLFVRALTLFAAIR